jgi:hypothetical protein
MGHSAASRQNKCLTQTFSAVVLLAHTYEIAFASNHASLPLKKEIRTVLLLGHN